MEWKYLFSLSLFVSQNLKVLFSCPSSMLNTGIVTRCPLVLKLKKITKDKNWQGMLSYKDQKKTLKDPAEIENSVLYGWYYSTLNYINIQFIENFNTM